ncbi:MAG: T9SS type A sorting domain-containing protein, partial [Actinobacteria bacterium]|nr:T9SS type A sorting domain-containing protein [Actinomycetota bacterium]
KILIVSSTTGVEIYSLTDESISYLSRLRKSVGEAIHFEKRDNLLFIADFADGLTIVDVTKVQRPKLLSKYYLNGNTRDIKVSGNYAYLADYVHGLVVMQISDPENPQLISTLHFDGGAMSLDIREKTIFLTTNKNELFAIDINDPISPKILHRMYFDGYYYSEKWLSEKNVLVAGDYVWVFFDNSPLFAYCYGRNNGFIEKARFDEPFLSWGYEIKAFDHMLFFSQENGIQIIDINRLSYIQKDRFASGMEWSPEAVTLDGDILYVSMGYFGVSGIKAYNMKDPQHPIKLEGGLDLNSAPQEMIFDDNYLFILTPAGIGVYSPYNAVKVNEKNNIESIGPVAFHLGLNYPNPFNAETWIWYNLQDTKKVTIAIYNVSGCKVRTLIKQKQSRGIHHVKWDGRDFSGKEVSSGVYLCQLKAGERMATRKMLLVR